MTYIELKDVDVDGCGTDVNQVIGVNTDALTNGHIERIEDAIRVCKEENPEDWDSDMCFKAATDYLESQGFEVTYITPTETICF